MVNFGLLATEIGPVVWSTPANVTARQSSTEHQPNFAALNRGRHLCSAGRPSRWALAHTLVLAALLCLQSSNQDGGRHQLMMMRPSASTSQLNISLMLLVNIAERDFAVAVVRVWNGLPLDVTASPSLPVKRQLKTSLFTHSQTIHLRDTAILIFC